MKKLLLFLFAAATLQASAQNAAIALGTQELRLRGGVDFDSPAGTDVSLQLGYGYFVADFLEIGGLFSFADNDILTSLGIGGFVEYNFDTGTSLVPYMGAEVEFVYADINRRNTENAIALGLYGGGKFFITRDLAILARLVVSIATEDIYPEDKGLDDVDTRMDIGLGYYF
jgi:opacity protein-like surface antigen